MRERLQQSSNALFAIAAGIWGSTWFAIKFQLGDVAPELSVAYRFALASVIVGAWCAATRRPLGFDARTHAYIALQGVLMYGLNYVAVYWAEQYATSGLVAVLFSTIVFMNPIGARIVLGTPLTARALVAALLGIAGVVLLFEPQLAAAGGGGDVLRGIALGLGATVLASAGNFAAVRNQRNGVALLPGIAWGMGYGALTAAAVAALHGAPLTFDTSARYLASLAYLAILGSVVAFAAYLTLLRRIGPGPAGYVGVATPVLAMVISTAFEGYRWTLLGAAGVALAIAGNWLALRPASPRRPS